MLEDSPNEQFVVILLDTKLKVIGAHVVSVGVLDATMVNPREVFRAAYLANAGSIIVAHNHPSGDTTPSREDWAVYDRLKECANLLGVAVLDSLIVGNDVFSMAENSSTSF